MASSQLVTEGDGIDLVQWPGPIVRERCSIDNMPATYPQDNGLWHRGDDALKDPACPPWLHHHHDEVCEGEPGFYLVRFTPRELMYFDAKTNRGPRAGDTGITIIGDATYFVRTIIEYKDPWEVRAEMRPHWPA